MDILVLRRRIQERIFFRHKITGERLGNFALIETREGDARFAFDMPPNVEIVREELLGGGDETGDEAGNGLTPPDNSD